MGAAEGSRAVHGEALHLHEHVVLARGLGVPDVVEATDGDVVHLGPERPSVVDQAPSGRMYKDGSLLIGAAEFDRCRTSPAVIRRSGVSGARPDSRALLGDPAFEISASLRSTAMELRSRM